MRKPDDGLWKLTGLIIDRIMPVLRSGIDPAMFDSVFGLERKREPKPRASLTPRERYWVSWFYEIQEIHTSINRLREALVYLGHYPQAKEFRFHRISQATWIRYHVEMYLQEEYILFNRLRRLLQRLRRTALRAHNQRGADLAGNLSTWVSQAFGPVVVTRGTHVHVDRFDDKELRDLDTLVLLTARGKGKLRALMPLRRLREYMTQTFWTDKLSQSNKTIHEVCARLFDEITVVLVACEPRS